MLGSLSQCAILKLSATNWLTEDTTMMTTQQIKWASEHDWFLGANWSTGVILVRTTKGSRQFTDFWELRSWAGY